MVQHNYRVFLFNLYKVFLDIFKKWGKEGYTKKFVSQAETWTCGYRIVEQENYSWRKELRKKICHIKANWAGGHETRVMSVPISPVDSLTLSSLRKLCLGCDKDCLWYIMLQVTYMQPHPKKRFLPLPTNSFTYALMHGIQDNLLLFTKGVSYWRAFQLPHKITLFPVSASRFGSYGKESACNAGDLGSIPGLRRSPGEGNGNPLQYSCLENPMDRRAWWATVHGVTKIWTPWVTNIYIYICLSAHFCTFFTPGNYDSSMLACHW